MLGTLKNTTASFPWLGIRLEQGRCTNHLAVFFSYPFVISSWMAVSIKSTHRNTFVIKIYARDLAFRRVYDRRFWVFKTMPVAREDGRGEENLLDGKPVLKRWRWLRSGSLRWRSSTASIKTANNAKKYELIIKLCVLRYVWCVEVYFPPSWISSICVFYRVVAAARAWSNIFVIGISDWTTATEIIRRKWKMSSHVRAVVIILLTTYV